MINGRKFLYHDDSFYDTYEKPMYHDDWGEYYYDNPTVGSIVVDGVEIIIDLFGNEDERVPHFHFFTEDKSIDGCCEIKKAKYFKHQSHQSTLTNKQADALNKFFDQPAHPEDKTIPSSYTQWVKMVDTWNCLENNQKHVKNGKKNQIILN